MRVVSIFTLFALSFLTACNTVKAPTTASGRPEVAINGAQAQQVKAQLASKMIDKGYRLVKDDSLSFTVEKTIDNVAAVLLLGTGYGPPIARVTYTVADLGGSVRVVADLGIVSNGGTAFEQRTDVSQGGEAAKIQSVLDQLALARLIHEGVGSGVASVA